MFPVNAFGVTLLLPDLCSSFTPFHLLSDLFDMVTLDVCEATFDLVEDNVCLWKSVSEGFLVMIASFFNYCHSVELLTLCTFA